MKRTILLFAALVLLLALPVTASAYDDQRSGYALLDDELPVIYGELKQRMATRTGPSTQYPEPGTFYAKGDKVRIISVAYDNNSVPWVQVDMIRGGKRMRVYTGFKRIQGVDLMSIPVEISCDLRMKLLEDVVPRMGPGEQYAAYDYKLRAGSRVTMCDGEGLYLMVDFYSTDGKRHRVWIPSYTVDEDY